MYNLPFTFRTFLSLGTCSIMAVLGLRHHGQRMFLGYKSYQSGSSRQASKQGTMFRDAVAKHCKGEIDRYIESDAQNWNSLPSTSKSQCVILQDNERSGLSIHTYMEERHVEIDSVCVCFSSLFDESKSLQVNRRRKLPCKKFLFLFLFFFSKNPCKKLEGKYIHTYK